jgi:uncharacterized membrane protein
MHIQCLHFVTLWYILCRISDCACPVPLLYQHCLLMLAFRFSTPVRYFRFSLTSLYWPCLLVSHLFFPSFVVFQILPTFCTGTANWCSNFIILLIQFRPDLIELALPIGIRISIIYTCVAFQILPTFCTGTGDWCSNFIALLLSFQSDFIVLALPIGVSISLLYSCVVFQILPTFDTDIAYWCSNFINLLL